jgi:poly-gamma-glutamate capsule biosynthesis protein CapA/YwtB (metallophosphatase superfamily)
MRANSSHYNHTFNPAPGGVFYFMRIFPPILLLLISSLSLLANENEEQLRIRAVGDIMLGALNPPGFLRPPEKGSILQYINPELQNADLTMGNLEGTLCDSGTTTKCDPDSLDCYVFRMEESEIHSLDQAGFDFLSLANNHVGDFGAPCIDRTEYLLDSAGIGWSGSPGSYAYSRVNGMDVAFAAFHSGGHCNSVLDIEAAQKWISELDKTHDIVIVSVHGGAEGLAAMHLPDSMEFYLGEARGEMIKFCRGAVDAGADLVFGHGPHVARAMEMYQGQVIAYSLGNFATYGRFNLLAERRFGGILEVRLDRSGALLGGQLISVEQKYWGVPFLDPENRFARIVYDLSQSDLPDSPPLISKSGKLILP